MSRFHTDDQWQKAVRDAVLGPGLYGPFSRDGRYVYIDSRADNPLPPFPLFWRPCVYMTAFGLARPGAVS